MDRPVRQYVIRGLLRGTWGYWRCTGSSRPPRSLKILRKFGEWGWTQIQREATVMDVDSGARWLKFIEKNLIAVRAVELKSLVEEQDGEENNSNL